jgi:hypothetical protein
MAVVFEFIWTKRDTQFESLIGMPWGPLSHAMVATVEPSCVLSPATYSADVRTTSAHGKAHTRSTLAVRQKRVK